MGEDVIQDDKGNKLVFVYDRDRNYQLIQEIDIIKLEKVEVFILIM